jgi:hypothetical protein
MKVGYRDEHGLALVVGGNGPEELAEFAKRRGAQVIATWDSAGWNARSRFYARLSNDIAVSDLHYVRDPLYAGTP